MANVSEVKQQIATTKISTVFDFLESKRDLIAKALPNTITPERLIGLFTMIIKGAPGLTECTQSSLIAAVIGTVQLGLQPGNIGHVYLVPFNNKQKDGSFRKEVQLIIGYKGLCQLVNNSKEAVVLSAEVVKENDLFEYEFGLNPRLKHIPAAGERGATIGAYAIAKNILANEKVFVYLQRAELDKVKASSKAGSSNYSPWQSWPEEMEKKTAVKRLCKLLPLSAETQKKISADETIKDKVEPDMVELPDKTEWNGQTIEVPPEYQEPQPEPPKEKETKKQLSTNFDILQRFAKAKAKSGHEKYYEVLGWHGFEHANEILEKEQAEKILKEMEK